MAPTDRTAITRDMRRLALLLVLVALGTTCVRPSHDGRNAAPRRFVAAGDQAVRDTTSGLLWITHDDGRSYPWPVAESRCAALEMGSRTDWRLPTIDELGALYDESASSPCGERTCRLDPAITLTDPYVWSGTERGEGRRFYIDFKFGTRLAPLILPLLVRRVLCVHEPQ